MKLAPLVTLALVALPALASAQGSLTPPAGAPAATMRTLDQIEPRRPLGTPGRLNTTTLTISESGSYVLQGDITIPAGDAIRIQADNVTLDLNGFTLTSSAGTAEGCGIRLGSPTATARGARIRNGRVYSPGYVFDPDAAQHFVGGGFAQAIAPDHAGACSGVLIEEVQVSSGQGGIDAGPDSTVSDCTTRYVATFSIRATMVRDSIVAFTGGTGIEATTVLRCHGSEVLGGAPAIRATTITASSGVNTGYDDPFGNGIEASGTVTDSVGKGPTLGIGIKAADALRCFGSAGGSGVQVTNSARFCFGDGGVESAVVGPVLIACWHNYGSLPPTGIRYLMPASP